jgi:hypothetical protein
LFSFSSSLTAYIEYFQAIVIPLTIESYLHNKIHGVPNAIPIATIGDIDIIIKGQTIKSEGRSKNPMILIFRPRC